MKFELEKVLRDVLIGKVFVDSEFSSKGDRDYYESIGMDYPPFDQKIINTRLIVGKEDPEILLYFEGGITYRLYTNDELELKDHP